MFCKKTIFCVSYIQIQVLMSLIIVTMDVWIVTSQQLVHVKSYDLLPTPQFPRTYFYNSVRLAQTLLHRNVRVHSTMTANKSISRDIEGEGNRLKKRSHHDAKIVAQYENVCRLSYQ